VSAGALVPARPVLLAQRDRTLADYAPLFLRWLGFVRQRRENTVRSYGEDLKRFLGFCAEADLSKPGDVTFRHIEFYLGLLQTRGLKASSANRHLHCLRSFWRWMLREGLATSNPAADVFLLPTHKTLPRYLTIPEQEQALAALARDPSPLGRRDYALVATALLTGLRCAELSNLQLGHVDLEAGVLRVVNGKGQRDRELPLVARLAAILRPYLEETRPALVGRPLGCLSRWPVSRYGLGSNQWRVVPPRAPRGKWKLESKVEGRHVSHTIEASSREEAERQRADLIPLPPPPPFVFVNAHAKGGFRVRRAGLALGPKTIFALVRRAVAPLIGRPVAPHMLRHSFASRLRENGADLQDIQEALGHSVITTTTMYAHLTTRRQREKLAEYLK